jgi:Na+/H+ antiporter
VGPSAPTDPEVVLVAVLAPLVFGEALSSSIVDLRRVSRPVMALAIGLVVFGAFVVGYVAFILVPGIPFAAALCLGAILAPTDAVAVAATAKTAGLPRRLVSILEGESLVNDGTALTLLRVAALSAAAGSFSPRQGALILATSVLGGLLVGIIGGALLVIVVRRGNDVTVANSFILIAPFPIYFAADKLEGSGILAVVSAALIVAQGTSSSITYTGRLHAASLWRTVTFILQAIAFCLVGLELPAVLQEMDETSRQQLLILVPAVFVALVGSRFVFVYLKSLFNPNVDQRKDHSWVITGWSGTRGPISALAAFTLPVTLADESTPFPFRSLIISTTFCVVLITLLLAPTIAPLARRLNLPDDDDAAMLDRVGTLTARRGLRMPNSLLGF